MIVSILLASILYTNWLNCSAFVHILKEILDQDGYADASVSSVAFNKEEYTKQTEGFTFMKVLIPNAK